VVAFLFTMSLAILYIKLLGAELTGGKR